MTDSFGTARMTVRRMDGGDAGFVLAMLNDPGFLANIGDRGVRTIEDARRYVRDRMLASYAAHGFGMLRIALRDGDVPVGMVGLVRRDGLDGPDLGFAILAPHVRRGYALEAARGLLAASPAPRPLLAITAPANQASAALLCRLGFVETGTVTLPAHGGASRLFRLD